jgi:hypothetical protein
MAKQVKSSSLEVHEDRPWQETLWTAQRVGWAVMALIVLAALVGLTGKGGPIASASAETAGATILYPRITRWKSDDQLTVRLPPSASGKVDVELSKAFGELFAIRSVEPEPSEVQATANGHRYTFEVEGGGDKLVVFGLHAENPAIQRTVRAQIADAPPAHLTITVLP